MNRSLLANRVLSFLAIISGCGVEQPDSIAFDEVQSALISPTPELNMPAVVLVRKYLNEQHTDYRLCTGALIGPRVVLTAKHCVTVADVALPPGRLSVAFGDDLSAQNQEFQDVESLVVASRPTVERDVAVLTLYEEVDWVEPLPVKLTPPDDELGKWSTLYGRGITPQDSNDARKVFRQESLVEEVTPEFVVLKDGACPGDSGGPLINEAGEIFAVVSRGQALVSGTPPCVGSQTDFLSRLDLEADMINQALQRAAGCAGEQELCGDHEDNDCDLRVDEDCLPEGADPNAATLLYEHCDFDGWSVGLEQGQYVADDLRSMYVPDRQVSSVKAKPGYQVVLYAEDELQGESVVVRGESACLVDFGFNDKALSLSVERITDSGNDTGTGDDGAADGTGLDDGTGSGDDGTGSGDDGAAGDDGGGASGGGSDGQGGTNTAPPDPGDASMPGADGESAPGDGWGDEQQAEPDPWGEGDPSYGTFGGAPPTDSAQGCQLSSGAGASSSLLGTLLMIVALVRRRAPRGSLSPRAPR